MAYGNSVIMPEEHKAATEFSIMKDIEEPLASLPADPVEQLRAPHFPVALRGYDRFAVDQFVARADSLVRDLHARSSPEAAVRRALEEVGEQVADILKRAHATAEEVTTKSRAEASERLDSSRREADETLSSARAESEATLSSARKEAEETLAAARAEAERLVHAAQAQAEEERRRARSDVEQITADGEQRVKDLDTDADRIWAERQRIIDDVRELASKLELVADSAAERFPADEELVETVMQTAPFVPPESSNNGGPPTIVHAVGFVEPEEGPGAEPERELRGTDSAAAEPGGAEPGGAERGGIEAGDAEPGAAA
jgi:F0F1-type ATP synthase membrane subunit b/b'